MEQQLLPSPDLKPLYDDVTWLFVTRNFDNDASDREATRTHDRFGISSWPQMLVFDPRDDRVLSRPGRTMEAFVASLEASANAVPAPTTTDLLALERLQHARTAHEAGESKRALVLLDALAEEPDGVAVWSEARELRRSWSGDSRDLLTRLRDPVVRERALALESLTQAEHAGDEAVVKRVFALLRADDEHPLVRLRALRWLSSVAPADVAADGATLLDVPNDPFRYVVLEVIAEHPDPRLAGVLAELFVGAGTTVPSENPNVLRMKLARCLGQSGDARAIDAIASILREANPLNMTTHTVIDALTQLAPRLTEPDRRRAVRLLLESFPAPADAKPDGTPPHPARARAIGPLVASIVAALESCSGTPSLPPPPTPWTSEARDRYLATLAQQLDR